MKEDNPDVHDIKIVFSATPDKALSTSFDCKEVWLDGEDVINNLKSFKMSFASGELGVACLQFMNDLGEVTELVEGTVSLVVRDEIKLIAAYEDALKLISCLQGPNSSHRKESRDALAKGGWTLTTKGYVQCI